MSTTPKPQASTSVSRPGELARVYVWEAPVWITHWLITLSIVVLIVTGFYIGNPFLIAAVWVATAGLLMMFARDPVGERRKREVAAAATGNAMQPAK